MKKDKVYKMMISRNWHGLDPRVKSCADDFRNDIMDKHGCLDDKEVEKLLAYLKPHLFRITKDYDGM
jgi:hypothetical protein